MRIMFVFSILDVRDFKIVALCSDWSSLQEALEISWLGIIQIMSH